MVSAPLIRARPLSRVDRRNHRAGPREAPAFSAQGLSPREVPSRPSVDEAHRFSRSVVVVLPGDDLDEVDDLVQVQPPVERTGHPHGDGARQQT